MEGEWCLVDCCVESRRRLVFDDLVTCHRSKAKSVVKSRIIPSAKPGLQVVFTALETIFAQDTKAGNHWQQGSQKFRGLGFLSE